MPIPTEIAEILVNGSRYRDWETVSVSRSAVEMFTQFQFTTSSPIESAPNWAALKLRVGDTCEISLAGRKVFDGRIRGRQPAFDANTHRLMISGKAVSAKMGVATVDHSKGEFKGYTLSQIAGAVLAPLGLKFKLQGETSGAEIPFECVNVQVGETVFHFIERLCRMRNIFLMDDADGTIIGFRVGSATSVVANLQEGRNILSGSLVQNYDGAFSQVTAQGQKPGSNTSFGDDARDVSATVQNSAMTDYVPLTLIAEMPGGQAEMKMRAQHEMAENIATQFDAQITVQGWHRDEGSLWLDNVGQIVSAYSPLLFTDDWISLAIAAAVSSQGPAGTTSTLSLVLPERFKGTGQVGATGAAVGGV